MYYHIAKGVTQGHTKQIHTYFMLISFTGEQRVFSCRKMLSQRAELLAGCQQCEVEHSQEGNTWEKLGRLLNDVKACAR